MYSRERQINGGGIPLTDYVKKEKYPPPNLTQLIEVDKKEKYAIYLHTNQKYRAMFTMNGKEWHRLNKPDTDIVLEDLDPHVVEEEIYSWIEKGTI